VVFRLQFHRAWLMHWRPSADSPPQRLSICRSLPAALISVILAAGCGSPTTPTTPTPGPRISCPAPQAIDTIERTATVSYAAPTVTGGTAPVSVVCTPPSGSSFPAGTHGVTCRAEDAEQRSDACAFSITVQRVPLLDATRFVAFGDSITYGSTGSCPRLSPGVFDPASEFQFLLRSVNVPASYPAKLQTLLANRYKTQSPVVLNEGEPSEVVERGVIRLPAVIAADAPQILLLQEGANNVNSGNPAQSAVVANGLRTMVRDARSRGVQVFLGTLLPQRPDSCRGRAPHLIAPTNELIRGVAAAEGAILVDLFQAFSGMERALLDEDGLHPTEAGYEKMAQTFFDVIQQRLESSSIERQTSVLQSAPGGPW
jgi:lysophospholipase L1-like esterase